MKLGEFSESVNIIPAVSPRPSELSSSSSVIVIEGGVPATVELLVMEVCPSDAASLPAESWMALVSSPAVGSLYTMELTSSFLIVFVTVSSTVDPATFTFVIGLLAPVVCTMKVEAAAVVAESASS